MNGVSLILHSIAWSTIIILAWKQSRKQQDKPVIWKMIAVLLVGLFSFSIPLILLDTHENLAILPLGVWVLFILYSRRNRSKGWSKYRKFAWLGFMVYRRFGKSIRRNLRNISFFGTSMQIMTWSH